MTFDQKRRIDEMIDYLHKTRPPRTKRDRREYMYAAFAHVLGLSMDEVEASIKSEIRRANRYAKLHPEEFGAFGETVAN